MDFDPRDFDSRDEERLEPTHDRGGRSGVEREREGDDEWSLPTASHGTASPLPPAATTSELPVTALEKTQDIARFKALYRKGRTLATVNRALGVLRAAVNWGRL